MFLLGELAPLAPPFPGPDYTTRITIWVPMQDRMRLLWYNRPKTHEEREEAPVEEKRIPSLLLNILFTQVEEMMGRRSLIMLLRRAGLADYIDNVPPMDDSPSITVEQYSLLLANIYDIFGARGSRPIFMRGGRLGAAEIRRQRPAQFAVAGTALKLLPGTRRMQIVLDRLAEQGEDLYGTPATPSPREGQCLHRRDARLPLLRRDHPARHRTEQDHRQARMPHPGLGHCRDDGVGHRPGTPGRRGSLYRPRRSRLPLPGQQVAFPKDVGRRSPTKPLRPWPNTASVRRPRRTDWAFGEQSE